MRNALHILGSVVVIIVVSGCATPSTLAPSRDDHAGAPRLLAARVQYVDGEIVRPGAGHDVQPAARAPAWSTTAQRYLRASDAAAVALSTPAVTADRVVNDPRLYMAPPIIGAIGGALVGALVEAPSSASMSEISATATATMAGALVGVIGGVLGAGVAALVVPRVVGEIAADDYERAVKIFNRDLASDRKTTAPRARQLAKAARHDEARDVALDVARDDL